jgi:membrane protease YdiL (CAAX protease family)
LLVEAAPESVVDDKRSRWFEVCLVLLITVGSAFLSSLFLLNAGRVENPASSSLRWINGLFHELLCMLLLGYVLSRRGKRLRDLGLRWSSRDFFLGIGIWFAAVVSSFGGALFLNGLHRAMYGSVTPGGLTAQQMFAHPSFVAIPFFLFNPLFEEMIVRAYLMTEVRALTGSWWLAGAMSVVVQTSYHLYYGWLGALTLSFQFVIFATYYARTQKATPVVVAHGIVDIVGLIRLW